MSDYVLNVGGFQLHPHLHQVSKSRDLHVLIPNDLEELISWAMQCQNVPMDSQSMVVREMLYHALTALKDANSEGFVPDDFKKRIQQNTALARYAQLKDEREREQAFLRMARDELIMLIKSEQVDRAKTAVEDTLSDFAKTGDARAATNFVGLPIVGFILDGGEWNEDEFKSERGII